MKNLILNINKYMSLLAYETDCSILGESLQEVLQEIFTAIRIVVPILVVILIAVDLLGAVTSGDEKSVKDAQNRMIKRLIIGVVIFFIPTIVNLILKMAGYASGTCDIG